jgi:hypothetical protein
MTSLSCRGVRPLILLVASVVALPGLVGCGLDAFDIVAIGCPCPKGYACSPNGPGCILPGGGNGGGGGGGDVDSGSPLADGGANDAGPSEPDPCRDYEGALFCSGFEDPAFPEFATRRTQAGFFEQDRTKAFVGQASLRTSTSAPSGYAALLAPIDPPVVSGTLYLRAHLFIPSSSSNDINALFLGNTDDDDATVGIDFDLADSERPELFLLGYGDYASGGVVVPRDRWFCFQSEIVVSDKAGSVTVSIDGEPAVSLAGVVTRPPGGLDDLSVGIGWSSDAPTTAEVYYDQVVLDDAPVPCELAITPL